MFDKLKLFVSDKLQALRYRMVAEQLYRIGYDESGRFFYYYTNTNEGNCYMCTDIYTHCVYAFNIVSGTWDAVGERDYYYNQMHYFRKHGEYISEKAKEFSNLIDDALENEKQIDNREFKQGHICAQSSVAFLLDFMTSYLYNLKKYAQKDEVYSRMVRKLISKEIIEEYGSESNIPEDKLELYRSCKDWKHWKPSILASQEHFIWG